MTLTYTQLSHSFKSPLGESRKVLDIPDWNIQPGQQILLRGVSGSGKTTLFNITAGLLKPSKGQVTFQGESLYALSEALRDRFRSRHIGYIFQAHYLLNTLTALENVIMPMAYARMVPRREWQKKALTLLDQMGLADFAHHRPAQLSTGQRMRIAVARGLINRPALVLADEPTASLDLDAAENIITLIQKNCQDSNAILIAASHDPALAPRFSIIANLDNGKVQLQEAPAG